MKCIFSINSLVYEENKYVFYLLDELQKNCDEIILCISTHMEPEFLEHLETYPYQIYQYDTYVDVNRWRDVIVNKMDYEDLYHLDSLLLINDSVMGPLYPLSNIFHDMGERKLDFWGITEHGMITIDQKEYPRFIQTYFIVINHKMLSDKRFYSYWTKMCEFQSFEDASIGFEYMFTDFFHKKGFKSDVYIETRSMENQDSKYFMSFILFDLYDLISKKKYPFLPKVIFDIDKANMLTYHNGDDLRKVLAYIRDYTEFDIEYIWENIIHRYNIRQLITALNLNFIISDDGKEVHKSKGKFAVFSYLYYEDLFEYSISKLLLTPDNFDLYIATDSITKAKQINEEFGDRFGERKVKIIVSGGKGRDIAALLVTFRDYIRNYDIFGFFHDKKSLQLNFATIGKCFNQYLWENLLHSRNFINNVVRLLEENDRLGLLCPSTVMFGNYFHTSIDSWTICFEECMQLAEKLQLNVAISREFNPVELGSCFWAKTKAVEKILDLNMNYKDFPNEPMAVDGTISHAIERIFPFVAQDAGYLTGYVSSIEDAESRLINYEYICNEILKVLKKNKRINCADLAAVLNTLNKI